jgi:exoribonuclease-2
MIARGFIVQFSSDAQQQTRSEAEPRFDSYKAKDLSSWLWSSIDDDDLKDLDQIEYALREAAGARIYIGRADVDWFVPYDSPLDHTAWQNTTSIYRHIF